MSRVILALGSFIAGACCMFLFLSNSGHQTWIDVQSSFAEPVNRDAVPVVPKSELIVMKDSVLGKDIKQQFDGISCENCIFDNTILEYGGGTFVLKNVQVSGAIKVVLVGPAANTLSFLRFLEAVHASRIPKEPKKSTPMMEIANIKKPMTLSFQSPY